MRKNMMKVALVAAVAAMAGYGVYAHQTKEMMSDVMLENVEALATGEDGDVANDCVGCVYISWNLCRTFGDWGACLGEWDGYTYEI